MTWHIAAVMPNIALQGVVEARHIAMVPPDEVRVAALRQAHANLDLFLNRFRTAHGVRVDPAVMLVAGSAPARRSGEALVAFRNCLSVGTLLHQHALELLYPHRHRVLHADAFEFYPWILDTDFNRMVSLTPAVWAIHQVEPFAGQPVPGSPVYPLRQGDIDRPLFEQLAAHWTEAYGRARPAPFQRALFRSLNMANAALAMPAVQGAGIFDYGRQCALWISAFEILAHHDAGRGKADLPAVLALLVRKPHVMRRLNARRFAVRIRGKTQRVSLAAMLYAKLYAVRNDILHGNPVTRATLLLKPGQRFIGRFAPLLYRCALRNYLDLRYAGGGEGDGFRYEEPQFDTEQALLLARVRVEDNDG